MQRTRDQDDYRVRKLLKDITLCEIHEILSRQNSSSPFDEYIISRPCASRPKNSLCHIVCALLWATYLPYLLSARRMLPADTVAQEQFETTPGLRETCLGNGRYPARATPWPSYRREANTAVRLKRPIHGGWMRSWKTSNLERGMAAIYTGNKLREGTAFKSSRVEFKGNSHHSRGMATTHAPSCYALTVSKPVQMSRHLPSWHEYLSKVETKFMTGGSVHCIKGVEQIIS
jgi:hypothetical protein